MRETEKQNCPFCSSEAEYYGVDFGNVKHFNCPRCRYFQVSRRAENHVTKALQWLRDQLLEQVKQTPEDHLLVIKITPGNGARDDGGRKYAGKICSKVRAFVMTEAFSNQSLKYVPGLAAVHRTSLTGRRLALR